MKKITKEALKGFAKHLVCEEKAAATVEKYLRDATAFVDWVGEMTVSKDKVLEYKSLLCSTKAPASVNSAIASINSFFEYCGRRDLRIKSLKLQRRIFAPQEKELSKNEYERLLIAAKGRKNERLYLLMQTVCATGIRVSELRYITVEAIRCGYAQIDLKGKCRTVYIPKKLCKVLNDYARRCRRTDGSIFISRNGNPLDRSNIWSDMKALCKSAGVEEGKVFPHNLRHLFARTYYSIQKDIVRLADILGHSSINTTRIYTAESGEIHQMQIQKLGLLRC